MVVCRVSNLGALEGELVTEVLEMAVTFVPLSLFDRGICIATNKESSSGKLLRKFINCIFKYRYFMDKFSIQATGWKIDANVDCDGKAVNIKD